MMLLLARSHTNEIIPIYPRRPYIDVRIRDRLQTLATEGNYRRLTVVDRHQYEVIAEPAKQRKSCTTFSPVKIYGGYKIYVLKSSLYFTFNLSSEEARTWFALLHADPDKYAPPSHVLQHMTPCCAIALYGVLRRSGASPTLDAACVWNATTGSHIVSMGERATRTEAMQVFRQMNTFLTLAATLG